MDSEMNDDAVATIPLARFEQCDHERSALAILAALFVGACLGNVRHERHISRFVGWGPDPDIPDGFATRVYLPQAVAGHTELFAFRMAPDESVLARALLPPFSGNATRADRHGVDISGSLKLTILAIYGG